MAAIIASNPLPQGRGLLKQATPVELDEYVHVITVGVGVTAHDMCSSDDLVVGGTTVAEFHAVPVSFAVEQAAGNHRDVSESLRSGVQTLAEVAAGQVLHAGHTLVTGSTWVQPSLTDAVVVGPAKHASIVDAVAEIEQHASEYSGGYVLHASVHAAAHLRASGLLDDQGRSPGGARWVLSPGYPHDIGEVRVWATGQVYVGYDSDAMATERTVQANTVVDVIRGYINVGFDSGLNLTAAADMASHTH